MIRFIILVLLAVAVYWAYNNFDFNTFVDNTKTVLQNEKTVKAVNNKRAFDYNEEQNIIEGNNSENRWK